LMTSEYFINRRLIIRLACAIFILLNVHAITE
jgi:hypothetical protein